MTRLRTRLIACLTVVVVLGALAASAQANPAHIVAEQRTGRVVLLTIRTSAFSGPTKVDVDLPTAYDSQPNRRWPVAYFLAGTMNTYASFNDFVNGLKLTQSFPAIVVSPNGDSGYWSDWYNSGAFGPPMYETYVIDQLIPLIDATFHTIPNRSERAIAGVSMGGYGASMLAAEHPDLFADLSSISGADDSNFAPLGAAVSASPEFQNGPVDAIYGPRATQEVRWRGHNPTDLAANLRDLDLQVRTANGVPAPQIGENVLSADSVSCVIESGVHVGSIDFDQALTAKGIPHLFKDYGPGCHTVANFTREITDTLAVFSRDFAHPATAPSTFDYESIQPAFDIWGWHVAADPHRALEFLHVVNAGASGLTLIGSGRTTLTSPPLFAGLRRVDLAGATIASAAPDGSGRLTFSVSLGAADTQQQFTPGAGTTEHTGTVRFSPHAVVQLTRLHPSAGSVGVCEHALGGTVSARFSLSGPHHAALHRAIRRRLGPGIRCETLHVAARRKATAATLKITGRDGFGHIVTTTRRRVRIPRRAGR